MLSFLTKCPKTEPKSEESETNTLIPRHFISIDLPLRWVQFYSQAMQDWGDYYIPYVPSESYEKKLKNLLKEVQVFRVVTTNDVNLEIVLAFINETSILPNQHRIRKYVSNNVHGLALYCADQSLTEKGFDQLLIPMIRSFTRLQRLNLGFRSLAALTDQRLEFLSREICNNASALKKFKLHFERNENITQNCISKMLLKFSRRLCQLEEMGLSFTNTINDTTLIELAAKGFKNMKKLTLFSLLVMKSKTRPADVNVTDQSLDMLGNMISKHLNRLQTLRLSFFNIAGITAKGIETLLIRIFSSLTCLKRLELGFSDAKIDDSVLIMTRNWAKGKKNQLKKLNLNFANCEQITEECVNQIKNELSFIPELEIYRGFAFF